MDVNMLEVADEIESICLPPELLPIIAQYLEDVDHLALSHSDGFEGFTALYNTKIRKQNNRIFISYKYFFLTQPRVWNSFFSQHALFPSSITIFHANDCYWIPAELLTSKILKMENLEELNIKGTKVSLPHLAGILERCPKIIKLDFSFIEKRWEDVQEAVKKEKHFSIESIIKGFKKLVALKVSTCILNARDYLNDPWLMIIRILSWCRNCVELTVEITYTGESFDRNEGDDLEFNRILYGSHVTSLTPAEEETKRKVQEDFFPHLDWMLSLRKLALIKLGDYCTLSDDNRVVRSLMLNDLFQLLMSKRRPLEFLRHIWIQDFHSPIIYSSHLLADSAAIRSYFVIPEGNVAHSRFHNIEHLAGAEICSPLPSNLPNLKYVRTKPTWVGRREDEVQDIRVVIDSFFRNHRKLEYLNVNTMEPGFIPSVEFKIPELKILYFRQEIINQELVDALVELYPNLEFLHLMNNSPFDKEILDDKNCLSAIRFKNLTSLQLYNSFELDDGSFLLPVIKQCPKLKSLHLAGSINPTSFIGNFGLFLPMAWNLRDLRLECGSRGGDDFPVLEILKSLLGCRLHLERLVLLAYRSENKPDWNHPPDTVDFLVKFSKKMVRLVCFCLIYDRLGPNLITVAQHRIAQEVVTIRPSLWFCLGREEPLASDPNVPGIHFHEMVDPVFYTPLPSF